MLTFKGDATFVRNFVHTEDSVEQGKAGAVSNAGPGSIVFKSKLTVMENEADVSVKGTCTGTTHCWHSTAVSCVVVIPPPTPHTIYSPPPVCNARCIGVGRREGGVAMVDLGIERPTFW